jgi:hypothetical protein
MIRTEFVNTLKMFWWTLLGKDFDYCNDGCGRLIKYPMMWCSKCLRIWFRNECKEN